jgi:cell division protein FtsB
MRPATAVLGTLAVVALLLASSVRAWVEQRTAVDQERVTATQMEADLARLQAENDRWDDPEYVKALARKRLNFTMPGEKAYVVIDDRVKVRVSKSPTDAVARQIEGSHDVWFTRLWDSIEIAGEAP